MDTVEHTVFRRPEEAVRAAANERGYSHFDLFVGAPLGSSREELIALDLYVEMPARVRQLDIGVAYPMCLAAILSQWNLKRHCGPPTAPKPPEHPAIARANRAAAAESAQKRGART